ncbi:MAG TPA: hypothetical protein VK866_04380 [Acidimicrobiales bacterium]|nr:hypothetical protein [Acidimicrobiales bacterium]
MPLRLHDPQRPRRTAAGLWAPTATTRRSDPGRRHRRLRALGAIVVALLSGPAGSASTWSDGLTAGAGPRDRSR